MADMSPQEQDKADKQRNYLARIETGGELSMTRYEPRDLPSLQDFANVIARSTLCPEGLQGKPADVTLVLISGAERGFTTMQSLQNLHVIYGRVSVAATMLRALCLRDPACEEFRPTNLTPESASLVVRRKDWPEGVRETVTYTVDDAKKAGYYDRPKSRWPKEPGRMCIARVTTVAADAYFPAVKAGLWELSEAEDEALAAGQASPAAGPPSPRAQQLAATLHEAAQGTQEPKATEDTVEGEIVEEAPAQPAEGVAERLAEAAAEDEGRPIVPRQEAESDEERWFHDLQRFVEGVGKKNGAALIKAGFTSHEKVLAATEAEIRKTEGVGERTAKALQAWSKRETAKAPAEEPEPQEPPAEREAPPAAPDDDLPAPWKPLPTPEGMKQMPVFRGEAWMEGLREVCFKHGVTWSEVVKHAQKLSGGYDPARLNDPQWKTLIEWVKSAEQPALPLDKAAPAETVEPAPPRYELVRENAKEGDLEPIEEKQVAQILRFAESAGLPEADLRAFLSEEWGYTLEALPLGLRIVVIEYAMKTGEYEEVRGIMVEKGLAREVA